MYSDSSEQQDFIFKGKVLYCSYVQQIEETAEVLAAAGAFAEIDSMRGVTPAAVSGNVVPGGTGAHEVLADATPIEGAAQVFRAASGGETPSAVAPRRTTPAEGSAPTMECALPRLVLHHYPSPPMPASHAGCPCGAVQHPAPA